MTRETLVLVSALAIRLSGLGFSESILWSQLAAMVCGIAMLWILSSHLQRIGIGPRTVAVVCTLTALNPMLTAEIQNGMEMLALGALAVLFVVTLVGRRRTHRHAAA